MHDLTARTAEMAIRVADLLRSRCSPESGAAEAVEFLHTWAKEAGTATSYGQPIDLLTDHFGLTTDEQDLLLLAGLPDEHEGVASTFRALHPRGEPQPTVGLAALVLDGDRAELRRLLHEGAAVRNGLLRFTGDCTFFERSIGLADQLWEALHGYDAWPTSIEREPIGPAPGGLDRWLLTPEVRRAVEALRAKEDRTLLVTSDDEDIALSRCAAVASVAGIRLVAGKIAMDDQRSIALLAAHAALRGAVPVLVTPARTDGSAIPTLRLETRGPVLVVVNGAARAAGSRPVLALPMGRLDGDDHRAAWRSALPDLATQAATLAARHPMDPALAAQVAVDVRSRARLDAEPVGMTEISALIRTRAGVMLPAGVDLTTPEVPWTRLVLPEEPAQQLRGAVDRLEFGSLVLDDWGFRERARATRGTRLLFTGPPGTGKSLAAEVVTTAAGTDLLTVDVSQVVSKWIGETEKNLAAVFDVAERTQAVLFLDEADGLFGTRTEISDAHDRYANLETAYLLQRLDRFDGLVVLATNLRHNIDPAFVRRMDYVVEFPQPDQPCRRDLWTLHLPSAVLAPDVDLEVLARLYAVPGGWIRNAAIAAGFAAAADAGPVGQHHLVAAMRREYAKAGQPFPGEPTRR